MTSQNRSKIRYITKRVFRNYLLMFRGQTARLDVVVKVKPLAVIKHMYYCCLYTTNH